MKKKVIVTIALFIISIMMYNLVYATIDYKGNKTIEDLKPYVLQEGAINIDEEISIGNVSVNEVNFQNAIFIEGKNTQEKKIIFGLDSTCIFGTNDKKPAAQEILKAASSGAIKRDNEGSFSNSGVTLTMGKMKVNIGSGEYSNACGITIKFINTSTEHKYAAYTLTLKDVNNNTKIINLITKSIALEKEDISDEDVDYRDLDDDDGYRDFDDDTDSEIDTFVPKVKPNNTTYSFISGADQIVSIENNEDAEFRIDADYNLLDKIYVNNIELNSLQCETKQGSIIVILKNEYLKTLSIGKQILKVTLTNGKEVSTNFEIKESNANTINTVTKDKTPKTGI